MPATTPPEGYLIPRQAAKILHCTRETVRQWTVAGCKVNGRIIRLQCEHVGARYFIKPEWAEEFKRQCELARMAGVPGPSPKLYDKADAERRTQAALEMIRNW